MSLSPSEGIDAILTDANIVGAGAPTWPSYIGAFPSSTEQCILITEGGGRQPEVRIAIDYPSIQILVRGDKGATYLETRAKAQEIFECLQAIETPVPEWPELDSCVARSHITWVGYDQERPVFSLNFNLIVSYALQGNRE